MAPPLPLWVGALVLVLLAASGTRATLQNSFCYNSGNSINTMNSGPLTPPGFSFGVFDVCLTFTTFHNYSLSLVGVAKETQQGYGVSATCAGQYAFAAPSFIQFVPQTCSQNVSTGQVGFCKWACSQFSGNYFPFFDNFSAPAQLFVGTAPPNSPSLYNWGYLSQPMPMTCNTTSCGSASGVVPNPYQGGNVSYTVRRFHRNNDSLVVAGRKLCKSYGF